MYDADVLMYDDKLNSSTVKSRHFRRSSARTSLRWTFCLSYVNHEVFRDILREIELAASKVFYGERRTPVDCALELLPSIVEELCEEN